MITAAEVAEREERNEITFPTPNGLSAKNRSDSDRVSLSQRERGDERKRGERKRKRHKEGEKNEEMRWDRNEMPSYSDVELERSRTDEQVWLAAADAEHTHTGTHTRRWGGLMMRERELPLSSTEDSHSACRMDNTYFKWPYYLFMKHLYGCVCVFVHVSLCSYLPWCISRVNSTLKFTHTLTHKHAHAHSTGRSVSWLVKINLLDLYLFRGKSNVYSCSFQATPCFISV